MTCEKVLIWAANKLENIKLTENDQAAISVQTSECSCHQYKRDSIDLFLIFPHVTTEHTSNESNLSELEVFCRQLMQSQPPDV